MARSKVLALRPARKWANIAYEGGEVVVVLKHYPRRNAEHAFGLTVASATPQGGPALTAFMSRAELRVLVADMIATLAETADMADLPDPLRVVVENRESGITVSTNSEVPMQVTVIDYHDDGDNAYNGESCWISDQDAVQDPALVRAAFALHRHDDGPCCECGSPDHCCCKCPTYQISD